MSIQDSKPQDGKPIEPAHVEPAPEIGTRQCRERRDNVRRRLVWGAGVVLSVVPAVLSVLPVMGLAGRRRAADADYATHRYTQGTPEDAVARLQRRIDGGAVTLEYDPQRGYLPAVLRALNIPLSSQVLVFSKTSVQKELISPQTPRALYFNDSVYVGYVPQGPVLEIAAIDPQLGPVYYNLLQRQKERPRFFRNIGQCMECHGAKNAERLPVHLLQSVYPDAEGTPYATGTIHQITSATPLKERWGGWYVTGTHGSQRHMGNSFALKRGEGVTMDLDAGANVTDLRARFDTSAYLSAHSDIVALLVLDHQAHLQNLITKANYETTAALMTDSPTTSSPTTSSPTTSGIVTERIRAACEPLVRGLLCVGEAPLTAPIVGTSGFAAEFQRGGPHDRKHRSLRQLDLHRRLLRYPCSYLIYSAAFDALPWPARDYVYRRLRQVLSGHDRHPDFAQISTTDRAAILEILHDTKPLFATGP